MTVLSSFFGHQLLKLKSTTSRSTEKVATVSMAPGTALPITVRGQMVGFAAMVNLATTGLSPQIRPKATSTFSEFDQSTLLAATTTAPGKL